jgi:hypothetical protein
MGAASIVRGAYGRPLSRIAVSLLASYYSRHL